jgi:hypothetical protein
MTTFTASPRSAGSIDARDEVTRHVLQLKDLVAFREILEARGATDTELDEHQRAIDRAHWRLAEAVKRRLAADRQLTRRLARVLVSAAPGSRHRTSCNWADVRVPGLDPSIGAMPGADPAKP